MNSEKNGILLAIHFSLTGMTGAGTTKYENEQTEKYKTSSFSYKLISKNLKRKREFSLLQEIYTYK